MDRRRFLFLFGGTSAGIALAGRGLIALPHRMAMLASGRCSYCLGSSGRRSLVGMLGKPVRICDLCVAWFASITQGRTDIASPQTISSSVLEDAQGERVAAFLSASSRTQWDPSELRRQLGGDDAPQFDAPLVEGVAEAIAQSPLEIRTRLRAADLLWNAHASDAGAAQYSLVANAYQRAGFHLKSIAVYKQVEKLHSHPAVRHEIADLYERIGLRSDAARFRRSAAGALSRKCSFCDVDNAIAPAFPVLGERVCEPCVGEAAALFEKHAA